MLSLFGFVAFAEAQVTGAEIERLLEAGRAEAEKGDFTKALGYFNKAMGYLKQASPKHPLNEVVRREIRVTKGRSLVARYRNRSGLRLVAKDELLPLDQEPREVLVRQRFGTVLAREGSTRSSKSRIPMENLPGSIFVSSIPRTSIRFGNSACGLLALQAEKQSRARITRKICEAADISSQSTCNRRQMKRLNALQKVISH